MQTEKKNIYEYDSNTWLKKFILGQYIWEDGAGTNET